VGNLPPDISDEELRESFEKYGSVSECDIVNDYAFIVSALLCEIDYICLYCKITFLVIPLYM